MAEIRLVSYEVTISDTRENCDQVFACEKFGEKFEDLKEAQRCYNKFCKEVFGEGSGWGDIEHKAVTLWQTYSDGTSISVAYTDKGEYESTLASFRLILGEDFNW